MSNHKTSRAWIQRHLSDPYVQQAVKQGYRSRASFKLLQLHERDKLFLPGQCVIDLGAAPGGWSQVLSALVQATGRSPGRVIAVDRLVMEPLFGVERVEGDFLAEETLQKIKVLCPEKGVDWVVSDMAPNWSGVPAIDQPRMMGLVEATLEFAQEILKPKGGVLMKVLQGVGFQAFHAQLKKSFEILQTRKPKASRSESSELYLLARGFRRGLTTKA